MTLKLNSIITITYTETFEICATDYLEECEMYEYKPSREHFKQYAIDRFEEQLRDDINYDNMKFEYEEEAEYDWPEEAEEEQIEFENYVYEPPLVENVDDDELENIIRLHDEGEAEIVPLYTKRGMILLQYNSHYYGIIYDTQTDNILFSEKCSSARILHNSLTNKQQ